PRHLGATASPPARARAVLPRLQGARAKARERRRHAGPRGGRTGNPRRGEALPGEDRPGVPVTSHARAGVSPFRRAGDAVLPPARRATISQRDAPGPTYPSAST